MRGLDGVTTSMDTRLSELQEMVKDREARRACKESNTTEQLSNNHHPDIV